MTTLYGIKNCDTVKKACKWLEQQQIPYEFHDFRADGLSADKINQWLQALGWETLINKRSTSWKQLDEQTRSQLNNENACDIILQSPTLIKRPLLETGTLTTVGFKENDYQSYF